MDKNDGDEGRELATTTDEGDEVSKRLERLLLAGLLGALMHRPKAFGEVGGVSIGCVVLETVSQLGMEVPVLLQRGDEDDRASWLKHLIIGDRAKRPESVMPSHPRRLSFNRFEQLAPINRKASSVKRGHRSNLSVDSGRRGGKVLCLASNSLKRGEILTIFLPPLWRVLAASEP